MTTTRIDPFEGQAYWWRYGAGTCSRMVAHNPQVRGVLIRATTERKREGKWYTKARKPDWVRQQCQAARDAGMVPQLWAFWRGHSPEGAARIMANAVAEGGVDALVVNVEAWAWQKAAPAPDAVPRFLDTLRTLEPNLHIGLCLTARKGNIAPVHGLAWLRSGEVDSLHPMAYWKHFRFADSPHRYTAVDCIREVCDALVNFGWRGTPIYPALQTYPGHGGDGKDVRMDGSQHPASPVPADELRDGIVRAMANCRGVSMFRWGSVKDGCWTPEISNAVNRAMALAIAGSSPAHVAAPVQPVIRSRSEVLGHPVIEAAPARPAQKERPVPEQPVSPAENSGNIIVRLLRWLLRKFGSEARPEIARHRSEPRAPRQPHITATRDTIIPDPPEPKETAMNRVTIEVGHGAIGAACAATFPHFDNIIRRAVENNEPLTLVVGTDIMLPGPSRASFSNDQADLNEAWCTHRCHAVSIWAERYAPHDRLLTWDVCPPPGTDLDEKFFHRDMKSYINIGYGKFYARTPDAHRRSPRVLLNGEEV